MAIASVVRIVNQFSSPIDEENMYSVVEASSVNSPAQVEIKALTTGANTITVPTAAIACTILMPVSNTNVTITLKKVTGDTGILLHSTNPTSIGLYSSVTNFVLTASAPIMTRLIWS